MRKRIFLCFLILTVFGVIGYNIYCYANPSIAILGYHDIYDEKENTKELNQFVIEKGKFEKEMKYLHDHKYRSLSLDEFYCWKQGNCKFGRKTVLITFDDGYYSNYQYAFEILKKYDLKATVFFVGSYTPKVEDLDNNPYMSFETIEKCRQEYPNIEFSSHSYDMHGPRNATNMTRDEITKDVEKFKELSDTKFIAYPEGLYNDDFIDVLKNNGYKMAFGFGPVHKKAKRTDYDFAISRLNIGADMPMWKFIVRINMPF